MRQLFPTPLEDVDASRLYAADERQPLPDGRPWVLLNMVASLDGATAVGGRAGPLGGPADRALFHALRLVPDVILVAAGTVRAEKYGPARLDATEQASRLARGQRPLPRLAIATSSLALDLGSPLFTARPDTDLPAVTDTDRRPIVLTTENADPELAAATARVAEVIVAGVATVDLGVALAALAERGARVVLVEGGPRLNGQLVAADLVDELCLTVSPALVSGESARVAHGLPPAQPSTMRLARALEEDSALFLRYVRA